MSEPVVRRGPPVVSIAELWRVARKAEMKPQERSASIANWIKETARQKGWTNRELKVFDAAAGDGEIVQALAENGFSVRGSDGSLAMILQNSDLYGIPNFERQGSWASLLEQKPVLWSHLSGYMHGKTNGISADRPHILLVPGSSIPYAGAWDKNPSNLSPSKRRSEIIVALHNFRESIRPGGVLLISTTPQRSFDKISREGKEVEAFDAQLCGHPATVSEEITHNPKMSLRTWKTTINWKQEGWPSQEIVRHAFMLSPKDLREMLESLGFVNIRNVKINGEPYHYVQAEVPA